MWPVDHWVKVVACRCHLGVLKVLELHGILAALAHACTELWQKEFIDHETHELGEFIRGDAGAGPCDVINNVSGGLAVPKGPPE